MLALLLTSIASSGELLNLSDTRIADWLNKGRGVTNEFLMYRVIAKAPIAYRLGRRVVCLIFIGV